MVKRPSGQTFFGNVQMLSFHIVRECCYFIRLWQQLIGKNLKVAYLGLT